MTFAPTTDPATGKTTMTIVDDFHLKTGLPRRQLTLRPVLRPLVRHAPHLRRRRPGRDGLVRHGTRFLDVSPEGKISEKGWFYPMGGSTSAAYWITDQIVYSVDYQRGIDILKFTDAPATTTYEITASPGYVPVEPPARR